MIDIFLASYLSISDPIPPKVLEDLARDLAEMVPEQPKCGPFAEIRAGMLKQYGEQPMMRAITKSGNAMVFLSNPETGTWTLFMVSPNGTACGLDAGEGFDIPHITLGKGA
jgi:hypothetical protein